MTEAQRSRHERMQAQHADAPLFSDLGFLLNLVRQMDNAARGITGVIQFPNKQMDTIQTAPKAIFGKRQLDMSSSQDQASREYVGSLLDKHGKPAEDQVYLIRQDADSKLETVSLHSEFYPESAVVVFIAEDGDHHCYDSEGYEVF
jgi:hypothetical protein